MKSPGNSTVVVVGAGPIGLSLAIDLAQRGISVIVLDKKTSILKTSRAICYSKESLAYFDKIGIYQDVIKIGVQWHQAKTYFENTLISEINYQSDEDNHYPSFINIQQYHVEAFLIERAKSLNNIDLRMGHEVVEVNPINHSVTILVTSKQGDYSLRTQYLVAADGVHSFVRDHLGLEFNGSRFDDKYLVIDFRTSHPMPNERRFWFNPPFSQSQSALLLPQADNIWRLDFQVGSIADDAHELSEQSLNNRMQNMFGKDFDYEILFSSIYRFSCKRLANFKYKNIFFIGDAAHVVSPFGARGANSGFQDAENLSWRLECVLKKVGPERLLNGYSLERVQAANQNILESTRSTNFISPKSIIEMTYRNAILKLSKKYNFASKLINCGRLYRASIYGTTDLSPNFISHRCPDIRLHGSEDNPWLYAELGKLFTILLLSHSTEKLSDVQHTISQYADARALKVIPLLISDEIKPNASNYDYQILSNELIKNKIPQESLLVIRPDNYIGMRVPIDDYHQLTFFINQLQRKQDANLRVA